MPKIISAKTLREKIENQDNLVLLDVRFDLQDESAGKHAYLKGHIPGAFHLDLKEDLASEAKVHGGENPLPDPKRLMKKLASLGIDQETEVLIYDQDNKMFAARAWWTLYYIGLNKLYILDGGYQAWEKNNYEVTSEEPRKEQGLLTAKPRENIFVTIDYVKEKLGDENTILIDSRAPERYEGKEEPLYRRAGHIPGAKNLHYTNVYQKDGSFKSKDQLTELFADLPRDKEIIVSCGSGVSACSNVIGLRLAGFRNIKLYPGSFSDWISYEENEVVNLFD